MAVSTAEHRLAVGQSRVDIGKTYHFWRDPTGQQTINEIIRRQYDPRWTLAASSPPNFQYTNDTVWLRFELISAQSHDSDYFLELSSPFLDDIEVHHVKRNHFGDLYIASSMRAGDDRTLTLSSNYRLPIFPIQVQAGASELVYVKVRSSSAISFSVALWQRDAYMSSEQTAQAFYGFFFGLMVVMACYNLVAWLFIKEPMYLCYVFYALSIVFFQASISGFGALYLWGNVDWLLDKGLVISISLSFLFGALFVWHLLLLKIQHVIYQKAVITTMWTYSGILLASLVLPESILAPVAQVVGITACLALLLTGSLLSWQGHEMARYFVVAWGLLLIGTVVYTLVVRGVLPRTPLTEYMQPVGMTLEVMLLAVVMALRVNQERDARKHAARTALDLAQKVNAMNAEKLMLFSEDNQVLEHQAVEQEEQLTVMRKELDVMKGRLDGIVPVDLVETVEGQPNAAKLTEDASSENDKIVSIERGRKDSLDN
ncbi:MAG: hypothetical protein KUG73_14690 [Pseudomonadales bacterium]|nr:hypothetical protein [Pseudomonadales bacterium]